MKQIKKLGGVIALCFVILVGIKAQPVINRVEYYVNTDPGYGLGIALPITAAANLNSLSFSLNISSYPIGLTIVGVRSRDANGAWSHDNRWLIAKLPQQTSTPNINRTEYYINTDPGYGNGTPVTISPAGTDGTGGFAIDITNQPIGITVVGVRSRDSKGAWSHDNRWLIAKLPQQSSTPTITRTEYYINTDPGYGNGTPVVISPAGTDGTGSFTIDISNQPIGLTIVGVRSRDSKGAWSHDNRWLIAKLPVENAKRTIKRVEYYIDADPGYGKGIAIAIVPANDLPNRVINANISGLASGKHYIFYRSQDEQNAWSHDNVDSFTLASSQPAPVLVVNSISKKTFCAGDSIKIGYQVTGNYTGANSFKAFLSDANGSFTSEVEIGSITSTSSGIIAGKLPSHVPEGTGYKVRIKSSTPALTGETSGATLTIHDRPTAQTITGLSSTNGSETWPYTIPTAAGSTWNWIVSNGIKTTGGTTNSGNIQWSAGNAGAIKPAQINVIETNQYGCVGDTSSKLVSIYKLKIGNMLSTDKPCPRDSISITLNTDGLFYTTPAANQFIAELSNASGSFTTPTATATITSAAITGNNQSAGIFKIGVPAGSVNGSNYRIRVRSTNPVFTGDTSVAITILRPNLGADLTKSKCIGFGYNLTSNFTDASLTYAYFTNAFVLLPRPDSVNAGTYNVIGTNSNGCVDTAIVTVTNYPKPNMGANLARSKCIGFGFDLRVDFTNPALSYSYFTNTFMVLSRPDSVAVGIYNVIGTNSNGCTDTVVVTISNYPKPNMGADFVRNKCVGFGYDLRSDFTDATLTYTYFTNNFVTVARPDIATSGTYNVIGTNSNGCKDTVLVTVLDYPKPAMGADFSKSKCTGFGYNLVGNFETAGLTYGYFNNSFVALSRPDSVDAGTHNVIGTNSNGCTDTVKVTIINYPKPSLGVDFARSTCAGLGYNLKTDFSNATLTYTYFSNTFVSLPRPDSVNAGIYKVIGTNSNGCADTVNVTVTNNPKPAIGADTAIFHVCAGETTNLVLLYNTIGLNAVWNTSNPTAAPPGTYRLIVSTGFGCTDTAFAFVILETATWTGTTSNNWHTAGNWNINKVPTLQTHVIIAAGTPNPCSINTADAEAASIQVRPGAVLQLAANRKLAVAKKCATLPAN